MEMNFCRRCGASLTHIADNTVYDCPNGHTLFSSPAPTVGVFFVSSDHQVTFAIRDREPGKGMLDTPGGFIDSGETAEEALGRELTEELGLQPSDYEMPVYFCSQPSTYLYQGEHRTVLSALFISRLNPGVNLVPQDDVAGIQVIPLAEVSLAQIAGDDIRLGVKALQQKLL